ncbi:hypothetical protein H9Y04_44410 [Streptomyces sp. TRM66268-LWL]|uniref:Tyr recombinase domain-containing protein n=1 Tax=Streptomyces polyasparticus TaxID=2767826 RepID=A0ABR7SVN8_9ACTN|nr:hypothetical protein [Streptomyces polyasparticus]
MDLGVGLGLRQGEVFGLAADDFDFEQGVVHIRRQLQWASGKTYFCLPKGSKERSVPVPPHLTRRVREALQAFPATSCTLPWSDPAEPVNDAQRRERMPVAVSLVITTAHGNPVAHKTFNEFNWRKALLAVGLAWQTGEKAEK